MVSQMIHVGHVIQVNVMEYVRRKINHPMDAQVILSETIRSGVSMVIRDAASLVAAMDMIAVMGIVLGQVKEDVTMNSINVCYAFAVAGGVYLEGAVLIVLNGLPDSI